MFSGVAFIEIYIFQNTHSSLPLGTHNGGVKNLDEVQHRPQKVKILRTFLLKFPSGHQFGWIEIDSKVFLPIQSQAGLQWCLNIKNEFQFVCGGSTPLFKDFSVCEFSHQIT